MIIAFCIPYYAGLLDSRAIIDRFDQKLSYPFCDAIGDHLSGDDNSAGDANVTLHTLPRHNLRLIMMNLLPSTQSRYQFYCLSL
jgi:hypothetical protein